jgi:hypothetical protein
MSSPDFDLIEMPVAIVMAVAMASSPTIIANIAYSAKITTS